MRYLLIDYIIEWKPRERIKGIKNIAMSEDFLEFHFPKNPIMPGILLLEALAQLTGWLEAASSEFKNWFLINKVRKCNFYGFALPGDQVELEVQLISNENNPPESPPTPLWKRGAEGDFKWGLGGFSEKNPDVKIYRGTGMVKGKKKITAEFEGEMVPLVKIEDINKQKRFFRLLTRESNL